MDPAVARDRQRYEDYTNPDDVDALRKRVTVFFRSLEKESSPPPNVIKELRKILGMNRLSAAAAYGYSYGRYCAIEAGGIAGVPNPIVKVVQDLAGEDGRSNFERTWARFREAIGLAARRSLEEQVLRGVATTALEE